MNFYQRVVSHRYFFLAASVSILLTQLILSYYGNFRYNYDVAPGDDVYNHLRYIETARRNPEFLPTPSYPPGFHYLVLGASLLLNTTPSNILLWGWPILLVLSSLAVMLLAKKVFGARVALVTLALYALVSLQPLQTAYDGTLANLFAGNVIMPLALIALINLWKDEGRLIWRNALLFALAAFLVAYSHHLSAIVLFGTFLLAGVARFGYLAVKSRFSDKKAVYWLGTIVGVGVLSVVGYLYLDVLSPLRSVVATAMHSVSPDRVWKLGYYVTRIGPLVAFFGFVGMALVVLGSIRGRFKFSNPTGLAVVSAWFALYFFGSLISAIGEPERLGRDWAMPGAIMAGAAVVMIFRYLKKRPELLRLAAAAFAIFFAVGFLVKLDRLTSYNTMVRFSQADRTTMELVRSGALPTPIYIWPKHPYWKIVVPDLIASRTVRIVESFAEAKKVLRQKRGCLITGYNKPGTYPERLQNNSPLIRLMKVKGVTAHYLLEDKVKIWYILCD
ncbi:hypothetical protein A3A71_00615 [Candidatus Berkelbacteria bacterium RIFCSPLOWO2_01_FULL_50_28]|uniref:Glycosyltransferase RgtA/B/C/D-like domain-containing protein n=1 Tax=Candidatus Berkelbacteria bacterium RIFCSPLOWO2_01_FULL_50_28 TaxID=1797471 RepID=A0A1F5EBF2_9BACT|nr:MAG: hypothetical protein A3F39_04115 [Candidatus Berkelbacteria bacterium RIFCSPHIGHO2_12_FULL_50_11]OGD64544.1 MAG: hypothetical protein A3A71_00615 [Candidatus Berkelbacteria bacterium RIFCSPLOWO2_01_FULL_50_28]